MALLFTVEADMRGMPASREDAIALGSKRYFNGRACPAGHVEPRYTLNGYCVECQRLATRAERRRVASQRGA